MSGAIRLVERFRDQEVTTGFAQTWSKEEEEEEEDNVEEEEEEEEEEEDEDTSAEQSLDESSEKPPEETQSAEPEALKEESEPAGEQKAAAEIGERPVAAEEEKPANGTADGNSRSQSGSNKKLSLFRRLSFTRSKQNIHRGQTPAEGPGVSGNGDAVDGEPPSTPAAAGSSEPEPNRGGAQQRPLPSGARGPRSGACSLL